MTAAAIAADLASTLAMDDAGFILGSYAITFGVISIFAWRVARAGRRLGTQIADDDKYWT